MTRTHTSRFHKVAAAPRGGRGFVGCTSVHLLGCRSSGMLVRRIPSPRGLKPAARLDYRLSPGWLAVCLVALAILFTGCSQYHDPSVPEPIRPYVEPELGGEYLLYRPSLYNREHSWPLFVVCHSSTSDSPVRQIKAWTRLAEQRGILIVAPRLQSARFGLGRSVEDLTAQLRADEAHILATLRHVQAGHRVSWDRVFIYGWSGGASAALHTGLRHPDVFRAVSVGQPKFESGAFTETGWNTDPHQPVLVDYSVRDFITGKDAQHCLAWLNERLAHVTEDSSGEAKYDKVQRTVDFFEETLRRYPLIQIRSATVDSDRPLEVKFAVQASFEPRRYRWEFGDQDTSPVAEPIHTYAQAGTYHLRVTVEGPKGESHERNALLTVPGAALRFGRPSE